MTPAISDWRDAPSSDIEALLYAEAAVWRRQLSWDVRQSWRVIEPARALRALPGFVARDASGAVVGWTWFLQHQGHLQVAALIAGGADVTDALVDAVCASESAMTSDSQVWSVRGAPPGLESSLGEHGLDVERYLYMQAPLEAPLTCAAIGRPWCDDDLAPAAEMFSEAYASGNVRAFAPGGTSAEWQQYLRTLLHTDGCGTMLPAASAVVGRGREIEAAIIVSLIDQEARTAHVSQVAVGTGARGRGLGRALLQHAMARCRAEGCGAMTLLVGSANLAARRLYAEAGFEVTGEFVVAATPQPRRFTSVALDTGGVSTRR